MKLVLIPVSAYPPCFPRFLHIWRKYNPYLDGCLMGSSAVQPRLTGSYISNRFHARSLIIALMMEAARTSETLVNFYQTTRRYNPGDSHLHTQLRENLKSYLWSMLNGRPVLYAQNCAGAKNLKTTLCMHIFLWSDLCVESLM
jgi:hypothetical protein